ncbi:MAG: hypothetical protein U5J63_05985 [Fodinibius sp.]|nr:hypothetical protein [Fodinibius sp.]
MKKRATSWEIVLAGLAFIGIGIYLFNQNSGHSESRSSATVWESDSKAPDPPSSPSLPGAIVIDLDNLESLQKLENLKSLQNLKNLENLKELEIELKNLDKLIEKNQDREQVQESLDRGLQQLEKELQKIEKANFNVKLQNKKVYINKDYNVQEATWSEASPGVFVFRDSFSIANLSSMDLQLGFGNVNIVGNSSSSGEITLRATGDLDDPAAFSKLMTIEKDLSSPAAHFRLSPSNGSNISDRINLEATLSIPKSTKITANTSGGHINASSLQNDQKLQTSGGHITLNGISGSTSAKTNGGHITCDEISGDIELSTGGGHIKINKPNGDLRAKTGGGHIEIQKAVGSIMAKTSGGNITTSIEEATGPLKFFTSAGNITLNLPTTITADLDISGSSVNLADAFDFSGTKNKGKISGTVNGGGEPVVASCGYGNVNIKANN